MDIEDWGESGGPLAHLKELNNHKRSERRFQLQVLLVFVGFAAAAVLAQALVSTIVAKDIILTVLPVFTFSLGKLDQKDG